LKSARPTLTTLLIITLAGCFGGKFDDGKRLLEEGKSEEGIARLEEAVKENPKNPEYRATLVRQRELLLARHLAEADALRGQGNVAGAERAYQKALGLDADNARAKTGLQRLHADTRLKQLLAQAAQLLDKGDSRGAETKLRAVLAENPELPEARALERRLADRAQSAAAAAPALKPAAAKPITLEFRDAPIRTVFEMISRTAGVNFVFDKDVRPDIRVTIFVRNSNIEDAVKLLLVTNQLERKVLNENSVLIYPNTPAKSKEYQSLVVRSFYLGNADAKQTQTMIKTMIRTSTVFIDEKLNLLIMRDTPEAVRMAEKLIAAQDLAEPEVMLEVEVLEVKRSKLQELGIQYPNQFTVLNIVPNPTTIVSTATGPVATTDSTTTTSQLTLDILRGGPSANQVGVSPNPTLNLRSESSDVNLLANPRIRVKNREKARIHIGDKVPVITTTSTANVGVSQNVSYLDIGLKLDVEPNVQLDDEVSIKVGLEVSNIVREITNRSGVLTYQVGTRNATTALRLKNGETQVLAGLITDEDRNNASKVPGLGDLPLIGRLFSTHRGDRTKTEIVLLITPRIVRNIIRPGFYSAEFNGGTDAAAGLSPLQISATAPGALALSSSPSESAAHMVAVAPEPIAQAPAEYVPQASLVMTVNDMAKLDQEVAILIEASPQLRAGQFDLVYDPRVLDGGGGGKTPGRMTVQFVATGDNATPTVVNVRFKPVTKTPADTEFRIENVAVKNAAGAAVAVAPPPPQLMKLVP
jgi:general secretion pathway protein D